MLDENESKKGFRDRARATLKGLTIDTKMVQNSYGAENSSNAFKRSPNGKTAPLIRRENDKNFRGKAEQKSPAADTKLVHDAQQVENAGVTGRKASSYAESPRLTEAMLNKNWRNHRRTVEDNSSDMAEPLWSAPPEKSKFPDFVKTKPQRDDENEVVNYDHGLKRVAYRCRRPENVKLELVPYTRSESVDAELCLSAPATKTEFSAAEIGTEEQSAKYNPSVFQPSVKSVVRLDDMAPTKRAGYQKILNWDEKQVGLNRSKRGSLRDSSSIATISLVDSSSSNWEVVEFPYAEIRPVKGDKQFETGLSTFEETIRDQLSALVVPQSAGLPPEYLRKEYEIIRKERQEAMALANSTIKGRGREGAAGTNQEVLGTRAATNPHFNDLLGKLNKLCAPRLRAFSVNDKDDAYVRSLADETNAVKDNTPSSPSGDSGISGLSSEGRKRSSTLNPEAIEFRCTKREKPSPATNESSPVQAPATKAPGPEDKAADPIRRLETRVAELEAQLARQGSKKVQFAQPRWSKGNKMNQSPYRATNYSPVIPGGGAHHSPMNNNIQSPGGYQSAPTAPPHHTAPGFGMGAGGMQPNTFPVAGQNAPGFSMGGMPCGFANQYNPPQTMVPFQGHGAGATPKPATGTPLWVKSVFGPKPVSKPDRPFRPGDGVQATRQQEYEEYLEHLRATDPAYAQSCKQRQARRADRQRSGQQKVLC
ncbi:hypothetical protein GGR51DRAFT_559460 [Nemania sp. FL0031]|nr:hypothetical protein GGR51DRAFT_559460 [Nemania sp. FL0031]